MTGTLSEAIVRNRSAGGGILRGEQSGGEQPKHHQCNPAAAPVSDIHGHSPRQKISVQYFIRDNSLIALVQMRSNDVVFGYKNDKAWQDNIHTILAKDLKRNKGQMIWHAGSLHVYERHFSLIS